MEHFRQKPRRTLGHFRKQTRRMHVPIIISDPLFLPWFLFAQMIHFTHLSFSFPALYLLLLFDRICSALICVPCTGCSINECFIFFLDRRWMCVSPCFMWSLPDITNVFPSDDPRAFFPGLPLLCLSWFICFYPSMIRSRLPSSPLSCSSPSALPFSFFHFIGAGTDGCIATLG